MREREREREKERERMLFSYTGGVCVNNIGPDVTIQWFFTQRPRPDRLFSKTANIRQKTNKKI